MGNNKTIIISDFPIVHVSPSTSFSLRFFTVWTLWLISSKKCTRHKKPCWIQIENHFFSSVFFSPVNSGCPYNHFGRYLFMNSEKGTVCLWHYSIFLFKGHWHWILPFPKWMEPSIFCTWLPSLSIKASLFNLLTGLGSYNIFVERYIPRSLLFTWQLTHMSHIT